MAGGLLKPPRAVPHARCATQIAQYKASPRKACHINSVSRVCQLKEDIDLHRGLAAPLTHRRL